jgi:CRISPR/Cas system-associated exonuclease Cas4 (RecB family)
MSEKDSNNLQLNQSTLQDFIDCPRRFELKILQEASWPAALSEPPSRYEKMTELGNAFHKICNQFFIGIEPDVISSSIQDPALEELWLNFYPYGITLLETKHYTEQILRTTLDGHLLIAKYDFLCELPDGSYLIIDWKTSSKKPERTTLANRVQTYLYPFILHESSSDLFIRTLPDPGQIALQYWYPLCSEPEEIFPYSGNLHQENRTKLSRILSQINDFREAKAPFPLTEDLNHCRYCNYKSYCERGQSAAGLPAETDYASEDLTNAHFDLDLIEEIEF